MRIAFFDGILETHVASSLQRAFEDLGHEVFNTGKFGRGFHFREERSYSSFAGPVIDQVLDFNPDWILVFRPGSAPFEVLRQLRSKGAGLAVWLSDDPVLFNLSYAPIVDHYDVVMHCGSATVLQYYEDMFGRPTGVNIPFWTDHVAFPYVYGRNVPETTAMFLGNMHDKVRRRRYFDLALMKNSVRVHGQLEPDYFSLSGGFLDTDSEVVDAGSRARVAINIPQFFRDHRGLETWFPGLDQLGFFQYPSRVIQYAAMGIPTISIIPGSPQFDTFPEMLVADDIQVADEIISELIEEDSLDDLSRQIAARFDMQYSSKSRALAMLDLFEHDSWSNLSVDDRARWFTQFDANAGPPPTTKEIDEISLLDESGSDRSIQGPKPVSQIRVAIVIAPNTPGVTVEMVRTALADSFGIDSPVELIDSEDVLPYLTKLNTGSVPELNVAQFLIAYESRNFNRLIVLGGISVSADSISHCDEIETRVYEASLGPQKNPPLEHSPGTRIELRLQRVWGDKASHPGSRWIKPMSTAMIGRSAERFNGLTLFKSEVMNSESKKLVEQIESSDSLQLDVRTFNIEELLTNEAAFSRAADTRFAFVPTLGTGTAEDYSPILDLILISADQVFTRRAFSKSEEDAYGPHVTKISSVRELILKGYRFPTAPNQAQSDFFGASQTNLPITESGGTLRDFLTVPDNLGDLGGAELVESNYENLEVFNRLPWAPRTLSYPLKVSASGTAAISIRFKQAINAAGGKLFLQVGLSESRMLKIPLSRVEKNEVLEVHFFKLTLRHDQVNLAVETSELLRVWTRFGSGIDVDIDLLAPKQIGSSIARSGPGIAWTMWKKDMSDIESVR